MNVLQPLDWHSNVNAGAGVHKQSQGGLGAKAELADTFLHTRKERDACRLVRELGGSTPGDPPQALRTIGG